MKLIQSENTINKTKEEIYPSVLSLKNGGLVLVQSDGIHFFDSNKEEIISKKIKFEIPILSQSENEKISICQFSDKEKGYILIIVRNIIYFFQEDYTIIEYINLFELSDMQNIKLIPYKIKDNHLLYIISYNNKNTKNNFSFNYYQFNLKNKKNFLIKTKNIYPLKNIAEFKTHEILGESYCLFMDNSLKNEDIFLCFFGVEFPTQIQAKGFLIKNELMEEKCNYKYLIGK